MFGVDNIITSIIGLGKSYIDNKEKQIEFANELIKMGLDFQEKLMLMQTTPKVDAFVKVLYAFRDVVLPLIRPVVSAGMTAFAGYFAYKGIQLPEVVEYAFAAAFPGWMTSRHFNKQTSK